MFEGLKSVSEERLVLLPGVDISQSDLSRWSGSIRPLVRDLCQVWTTGNPFTFAKQSLTELRVFISTQCSERFHSTVSQVAVRLRGTPRKGFEDLLDLLQDLLDHKNKSSGPN